MLRRLTCVTAVVLASTGCSKWKVLADPDPKAMEGQSGFVLLPIDFSRGEIDGDPSGQWLAAQDADQKKAWPRETDFISNAFRTALTDDSGGLTFGTKEDPKGATLVLRPYVVELETGGYKYSNVILGVEVLDAKGAIVESITTKRIEGSRRDEFQNRVAEALENAAEIIAKYLKARTGR